LLFLSRLMTAYHPGQIPETIVLYTHLAISGVGKFGPRKSKVRTEGTLALSSPPGLWFN
jgi:hypothetical protein